MLTRFGQHEDFYDAQQAKVEQLLTHHCWVRSEEGPAKNEAKQTKTASVSLWEGRAAPETPMAEMPSDGDGGRAAGEGRAKKAADAARLFLGAVDFD